jgi:hypothetical protein
LRFVENVARYAKQFSRPRHSCFTNHHAHACRTFIAIRRICIESGDAAMLVEAGLSGTRGPWAWPQRARATKAAQTEDWSLWRMGAMG